MRVVGGRLRGRALVTPKDDKVRPTSDRVREAIFNILEHGISDFSIDGTNVLDLFAGTGALGIEALSRGAAQGVFVENAATSRALLQENFQALGLGGITTVYRRSATDLGAAYRKLSFQLIFADPPYGQALATKAIAAAIGNGWLSDGAVIVIEETADTDIELPPACHILDQRTYGSTQVLIAKYTAAEDATAGQA